MQGFNVAEQGHVVNILPPKDISGGATCDRFTMENYGHATIIVTVGVSAAAFTALIVKNCTLASGGTATAIAFSVYKEETAAGDTLGARTAVAAAGMTPNAADNITYVIELDARELTDGYPWVEVSMTNASGNSVLCSAVAILSGARFSGDQSATAIA
jgi:hypothetical protein